MRKQLGAAEGYRHWPPAPAPPAHTRQRHPVSVYAPQRRRPATWARTAARPLAPADCLSLVAQFARGAGLAPGSGSKRPCCCAVARVQRGRDGGAERRQQREPIGQDHRHGQRARVGLMTEPSNWSGAGATSSWTPRASSSRSLSIWPTALGEMDRDGIKRVLDVATDAPAAAAHAAARARCGL